MGDTRDFSWAVRYLFCIVKVTFKSCVVQHNDMLYSLRIIFGSSQGKGNRVTILPLASPQEALLNSQFLTAITEAMRTFNSKVSVHLVAHKPLKDDPQNKASLIPLSYSKLKTSYPSNSYPCTLHEVA